MKTNTSSRRKFIIASTIFGMVILSAIVSIVAVLAATTQNVNSSVEVAYRVNDVSATVSAKYARAGAYNNAQDIEAGYYVDAGSKTFNPQDGLTTGTLNFSKPLALDSTHTYVIYEFAFQNNSSSDSYAHLTAIPSTITNMRLSYTAHGEGYMLNRVEDYNSLDFQIFYDQESSTKINDISKVTTIFDSNEERYIYIKAEIIDLNKEADLKGTFAWELNKQR